MLKYKDNSPIHRIADLFNQGCTFCTRGMRHTLFHDIAVHRQKQSSKFTCRKHSHEKQRRYSRPQSQTLFEAIHQKQMAKILCRNTYNRKNQCIYKILKNVEMALQIHQILRNNLSPDDLIIFDNEININSWLKHDSVHSSPCKLVLT